METTAYLSRTIWANTDRAENVSNSWSIKAVLNKPGRTIYNLTSRCACKWILWKAFSWDGYIFMVYTPG